MPRPHIEPFVDRDVGFKKMTMGSMPNGMQYKTLSMDTDNGAVTMTVQYDAGYKSPPGFCYNEIELFIQEGSLKVGDQVCGKGHYFFIPAGKAMPAISSEEGALCLIFYNYGPPSFEESDANHDECNEKHFASVSTYDGLDWAGNALYPATAPGCLLKMLHYDEKTHGMTFLYCMVPGFWQDNISYHDVAEEAYHIWGTSWMMQFGNLPTGGYFWRPAYINHGCFASEHGILAIGRTDGDLHNHFHHDPYSTPQENAERAASRLARQRPAMYKWILTQDHNHVPHDFENPHDHTDPMKSGPAQIIEPDGSHWP